MSLFDPVLRFFRRKPPVEKRGGEKRSFTTEIDKATLDVINELISSASAVLNSQFGFYGPPGRDGVIALNKLIERDRRKVSRKTREDAVLKSGFYLGAALINAYGGRWVMTAMGHAVEIRGSHLYFPVGKAQKHWGLGAEDSVLDFFDIVGIQERKTEEAALASTQDDATKS